MNEKSLVFEHGGRFFFFNRQGVSVYYDDYKTCAAAALLEWSKR